LLPRSRRNRIAALPPRRVVVSVAGVPVVPDDRGEPLNAAELAAAAARSGADEIFLWLRRPYPPLLPQEVRTLAAAIDIPLLVGPGPSAPPEIEGLFEAGASRIFVEGAALGDPDLVSRLCRRFGSESIGVMISARHEEGAWRVWDGERGAQTEWDAVDWARVLEAQGAGELLLRRAGAAAGTADLELLRAVGSAVARPVMALVAGQTLEDVLDSLLIGDVDALLLDARRLPGGRSIAQIKKVIAEHGLSVRL
jgi:cyclase